MSSDLFSRWLDRFAYPCPICDSGVPSSIFYSKDVCPYCHRPWKDKQQKETKEMKTTTFIRESLCERRGFQSVSSEAEREADDIRTANHGKHFVQISVEIPKGYRLRKEGEGLEGETCRYLQQSGASHGIYKGLFWTRDTNTMLGDIVIIKEKTKKDELLEKIEELKQQVKELED